MNLAELGAVVTVISSGVAGGMMAHSQHAGWMSIIFAVVGLVLGILIALLFGKLAFTALFSHKTGLVGGVLFGLYCLLPLVSIAVGVVTTFFLTATILHQFQ
jgi:hypothetical protein